MPAVLNAANEVAVDAFLHNRLPFVGIMDVVERVTTELSRASSARSLDEILAFDKEARETTNKMISI